MMEHVARDITALEVRCEGNRWPTGGSKRTLERQVSAESFDSSWNGYLDEAFCPPNKRIRRSKKSVRFAPSHEIQYRHVSEEDLANSWLKPQDWERSKAECKEAIDAIVKANGNLLLVDLKRHCVRGLEEYISTFIYRRGSRQRTIVRKVVYVHHFQRKHGVRDQLALKKAYLALSKKHRFRALKRGAADAYYSGAVPRFALPCGPED